jgi:hypothetical protein
MNEIIVIENFLKNYQQDSIEDVLTHNEFPYFLYKVTVDDEVTPESYKFNTNVSKNTAQFIHIFSFNGNNSTFLNHVSPLYNKLIDLLDDEYFLIRCKANLNFQDESYLENHYYTPHIDNDDSSGISAIYYVNDSDGDTYFFNENKEIVKRVSPKKGTLVYWPNGIFHAGSPPKKSKYRVVININLKPILPKYY